MKSAKFGGKKRREMETSLVKYEGMGRQVIGTGSLDFIDDVTTISSQMMNSEMCGSILNAQTHSNAFRIPHTVVHLTVAHKP